MRKKKWTNQNPVFSLNILNYYYMKIRAKRLISFWKTVGDMWHGAGTCGPLLQFSCWHVTAEMSPVFIALEASSLSGKLLSFVRLHSFLLLDFPLLVSPHFSPSFYSLRYLYSLLLTSHWQFCSVWFQQWSKGKQTSQYSWVHVGFPRMSTLAPGRWLTAFLFFSISLIAINALVY